MRVYAGYFANVYVMKGKTHVYDWHTTRGKAMKAASNTVRVLNSRVRIKNLNGQHLYRGLDPK